MLYLQFPNTSHKKEYIKMIEEWALYESIPTSPRALFRGENFEEFLEIAENDLIENRLGVPATLFFLMDDSRIIGAIQIRHHIEHPNLKEFGGHIGYGIRPSERRKGYATKMLELGLIEVRKLGLDRVLIGCDDDNIASAKTIESNGGIFEGYTEHEGKRARRYWVEL